MSDCAAVFESDLDGQGQGCKRKSPAEDGDGDARGDAHDNGETSTPKRAKNDDSFQSFLSDHVNHDKHRTIGVAIFCNGNTFVLPIEWLASVHKNETTDGEELEEGEERMVPAIPQMVGFNEKRKKGRKRHLTSFTVEVGIGYFLDGEFQQTKYKGEWSTLMPAYRWIKDAFGRPYREFFGAYEMMAEIGSKSEPWIAQFNQLMRESLTEAFQHKTRHQYDYPKYEAMKAHLHELNK